MTERSVQVPGGRLHVFDEGAGPAIVLLHAGIADARAWAEVVPRLVASGYRAVAYDRRGHGRSTTDDVAFSSRADLVAVLDALGIDQACLVGNSNGGQLAVDTAIEYPARVAALVTIGANISGYEPEPTPEEALLFAEMGRLEELGDADAIADLDVRLWVDGQGQPATRVPSAIRESVRAMDRAINEPGRVSGRPIRLDPPAAARLHALTMPVLAVAGALDVSDVLATARHVETTVPGARAVIVPDVAHMVGLEAPEQLAALIVGHLRTLGRF